MKAAYVQCHLAYQTDGAGNLLASFAYDNQGIPVSVQVGSDPSTAPRYSYVYNGHGDVTFLTDTSGAVVASYLYDAWGNLTSSSESFPGGANGWTNPYRYDGRDGARYDASDGLYWLSVRAYDPSLGRFLSRDPLGRAPLFFADNPYVYAGNNPLSNVDPSGQRALGASNSQAKNATMLNAQRMRMTHHSGDPCANPQSPQCRAIKYAAWAIAAKRARQTALQHYLLEGHNLVFAGATLAAIVDILAFTSPVGGLVERISAAIDLGVTMLSLVSLWPGVVDSYQWVAGFLKVVHALVAAARYALGLLDMFGVFAKDAAEIAVDTAAVATGGWTSVLNFATGFALRNFIGMSGRLLFASGQADIEQYYRQASGNIDPWCGQNAGVCPSKASYGL